MVAERREVRSMPINCVLEFMAKHNIPVMPEDYAELAYLGTRDVFELEGEELVEMLEATGQIEEFDEE